MNKQETRQIISLVFGTCDTTQIKYSSIYQLFHEKLARENDGICCVENCTSPITNISYTGEVDVYELRKSSNWLPYCRFHKRHPIPELHSNVVSSQSSSRPVSGNPCESPNVKHAPERDDFYFDFKGEKNK